MNGRLNTVITSKGVRATLMAGVLLFMSGCSQFFFYPQKALVRYPSDIGLSYEDVQLSAADGVQLHSWLLKADNAKGIVLFLHGNAENISTHIGSVYWLPEQGYEVLLLDYRGFGRSKGAPAFPDVFLDVAAAYQWVVDYATGKGLKVFVLGQSLGAAASGYYFSTLPKSQRSPDGIVLDAVFSSQVDIAKNALGKHWLTWPLQFAAPLFLSGKYAPVDHVAAIYPVPLLFFHSPDDAVVPYEQGLQVYEAARSPKRWSATKGAHIATFGYSEYQQQLIQFFEQSSILPDCYIQPDQARFCSGSFAK